MNNELTKRVAFALPAALLFLWFVWMGGVSFKILMAIITGITLWEIHRMMSHAGAPDLFLLSLGLAIMVWLSGIFPDPVLLAVNIFLLVSTIWAVVDTQTRMAARWLSTLFCGIYAPVGFLMFVYMRSLGGNMEGFWLTVALLLMIWGNDVFAYFGGRRFGKRQLAPLISPKKTWEGFWCGFLGSAVGFLIAYAAAGSFPLPLVTGLPAVIIVSVFGPGGDLVASRLKRMANVKDSSSILPGHGGLLDRFDSLILTAPFIFFYFYFLMK